MKEQFHHIFIPAKNKKDSYTILLLHGTGGDENDLVDIGRLFGKDVNLLSVRGKVLEGGMPRYFKRLAEGVFDMDDLKLRTKELYDYLVSASDEFGIDKIKIIALGYSNGANIAGSIMLTYPDFLSGMIQFRPMKPFDVQEKINFPEIPVFISAGRNDFAVSLPESKSWADELQSYGAKVDYNVINSGHNLTNEDIELSLKWFQKNFSK
ncbi:MAG TPA: alpha/beta hydrolase [Ignavibacteria bacterium]|nr:alpha/beta hydrolase [Ignavibacteria bacterium]